MVFHNFNPELQKAITKRFKTPTLPQEMAIKPILEGKNVLLIAQTGTGKCVSGDTMILTEDGPTQIKDVYGKKMNVNACDDNFQIKMHSAIVIQKKRSKLYSLKTSTGRVARVTDDHKFMVLKNGRISWIPLKNISKDQFVALARKYELKEKIPKITLNLFENYLDGINVCINPSFRTILTNAMKKLNLSQNQIARQIKCSKSTLIRSKKNNWVDGRKLKKILDMIQISTNSIEIIKIGCKGKTSLVIPKIDEKLSYFIGLVIGDGNFNVNNLRFTTSSEQLLKIFTSFANTLGLKVSKDKSRKYDYYICSKPLLVLLYSLGLPEKRKAANVKIPNILFSKYKLLSKVLRGIYDTDGSIYGTTIELTTKSKILAQETVMALSCFGIFAILKNKKVEGTEYKRVVIQNVINRKLFSKNIGFGKNEKSDRLRKTLSVTSNPNIDVIPEINDTLMKIKEEMDVKWSNYPEYASLSSYINKSRTPTRKNLIKIINYIKKFSRKKILTDELMFLENLAVTDIFWDKVTQIRADKEEFVYDATVPNTRNFVGNGIILHNTESAMLPLFNMVMEQKAKPISILYITPLRSLNRDLLDRLIWWCNELGLEASVRHGDTSPYERKMQSEFPPHLLITTPETVQAILSGKILREHLKNVKWVVVDEIHELADSKRGTQLTLGLERVRELCGDFQIIGLSATVGKPEQIAQFICPKKPIEIIKADTTKAYDIKVISPNPTLEDRKIADRLFTSKETAARIRTIVELIKEHRSVLTFTNTREFAEILSSRIKTLDNKFPIGVHHSSLSKEVRIKTEKEFKEEKIKSIISTSSLQLGIDIGSVDLVLQYMSPRTVSQLIQRAGRSGHDMQRISKGIIIATNDDDIFEAAVIARKALAGELEELKFHENSFDILAHQIVGLALDQWNIETGKAYDIVKRAFPFRHLTLAEFMEVLKQLQTLYMISMNGTIRKMRRGFDYYFSQLSTIPDSKQYRVFNTLDNSFVGVLDEEFVAIHGEPNTNFIIKGQAWRIIQVEEGKVLAEPVEDIEAAIPGWEGELIPVPYAVAQEVGRLRKLIKEKLQEKDSDVEKEIQNIYPVDSNCAKKMIKLVDSQKKFGTVPDDKVFLAEDYENILILHTCLGAMTNESLGRFMVALLTSRIGSVGLKTDPYRIILEFQKKDMELVKEILFKTDPNLLRSYLEMSVSRSPLFEWKFVHVAKRFGAITRDAEYGRVRLGKIIDSYAGTPIYKETLKELEVEKFDMEKAAEVLRKIQSGEIKIIFKTGLSPIGKLGLKEKYAEVIGPDRPESEIFGLFKKRLLDTKVRLVCVNCGMWSQTYVVKEIPDKVKCSHCSAKLLATVNPRFTELQKIIKKKLKGTEMGIEENKRYERARRAADLFLVYGKKASVAMAARGIGPQTASRVLAGLYRNEEEFLRSILQAERNYIKTRKYWSV